MLKEISRFAVLSLIANEGLAAYEDCFKRTDPLLIALPEAGNPITTDVYTKDLQVVLIKVCFDLDKIYSINTTWGHYIAQQSREP